MSSSDRKVFCAGCEFNVSSNVYEPAEDSYLLADNLDVEDGNTVVDVGTGCGILGIIAAKKARKVLAVDVNPEAVRCARENARLNRVVERMWFVRGDMLAPIATGQKFDVIVFNAPYLPVKDEVCSWLGRSWSGGAGGRQVIERFIREAPHHLQRHGRILLVQSSLAGIDKTLNSLAEEGLEASVVASRKLPFFETIALIRGIWASSSV